MPNGYPPRFVELYHQTTGRVLDNGSGGRAYPRVVSFEYTHSPEIDVRGDGLDLPFRDNCFELVLSQAVVEHVTDPQRYIDEIVRVLQPGGLLYVEVAFLQPVHMPPMHYFNVTPYGLAHLCRNLDILEQGTVGTFGETIDWICRDAGVREPHLPECVDEKRPNVASGVTLLGRKP